MKFIEITDPLGNNSEKVIKSILVIVGFYTLIFGVGVVLNELGLTYDMMKNGTVSSQVWSMITMLSIGLYLGMCFQSRHNNSTVMQK